MSSKLCLLILSITDFLYGRREILHDHPYDHGNGLFPAEDGKVAEQKFLELLTSFSEVWICAFGFTLQPMFDELRKADTAGAKLHILLDHSQAMGKAELTKLKDLVSNLKQSDVTVTTAGVNSDKKDQFWHWKGWW